MDTLIVPSVSEQDIENSVNKKLLLPRKPARQPNPIIYRRLRRGSAATRIPEKQIEFPTNKELLRTIAYLRNATTAFYEPDKILTNKAYINDEDDEEGITGDDEEHNSQPHDEKGKQKLETSIQKSTKNSSHTLTKNRKKKSSLIDKANKECGVSSSTFHVIKFRDMPETSDHGQGSTKKLHKSGSTFKAFIHFCSTKIICPQEHRATLAVKLFGIQAALLSALGNPFDNLFKSMSSGNSSKIILLSLRQASIGFLPAVIWSGMFIVSFVYTVMVVWSLAFRVPVISMLCLALLYCLSVLVAAASGFNVIWGTFRMNGILFTSLGVLGFLLLLLVWVMLVLFASWGRTIQEEGGAK